MQLLRPKTLLVIASFSLACSSKDSPPESATSVYGPAASATAEPTANDISNYELDMDKMRKWAAAIKGFSALSAQDTAALAAMDMGSNSPTSVMIAKIEANPVARDVLTKAGISAKDYVWTMAAYLQAGMTEAVLSSSPNSTLPEGQNRHNVDFVRTHKAELEQLMKEAGMSG